MVDRLIIVGASARAAAASAQRAGFAPWTADLFADADLRALVPDAVRCPASQYPGAFREILAAAPDAPWVYTGGLENHPNLIRALSDLRPPWGNGPNALAACRSPFTVERLLREAGLPTAEVRAAGTELPASCRWLRKPLSGTGGHGIESAHEMSGSGGTSLRDEPPANRCDPSGVGILIANAPALAPHPGGVPAISRGYVAARRTPGTSEPGEVASGSVKPHYYQQFLEGPAYAAVFLRARNEVRLLGVTEQLIGPIPWLNAVPFSYAGNIGPVELEPDVVADLMRIGRMLGEGCGLLGLFGVDFILHAGRPYVVEVNPRYTASVEVIERATGVKALGWHRLAFDPTAAASANGIGRSTMCAKAVVYASHRIVIPDAVRQFVRSERGERNDWHFENADVPHPGEVIESGWPILSVLREGGDRRTCIRRLKQSAFHVLAALASGAPSGARY